MLAQNELLLVDLTLLVINDLLDALVVPEIDRLVALDKLEQACLHLIDLLAKLPLLCHSSLFLQFKLFAGGAFALEKHLDIFVKLFDVGVNLT